MRGIPCCLSVRNPFTFLSTTYKRENQNRIFVLFDVSMKLHLSPQEKNSCMDWGCMGKKS
jgi:hypothetical protein